MNVLEREFNSIFEPFDICLPADFIASQESGRIVKGGWTVWFTFGKEGEADYLDYYASHRMTNDRHVRLHADGRRESLDVVESLHSVPTDPKEADQAKEKFYARNRAVRRMLDKKGFTLDGHVHRSVSVNHYLLTGKHIERGEV